MQELNKDLEKCCEGRNIDPIYIRELIGACSVDMQCVVEYQQRAGVSDPPILRELGSFISDTRATLSGLGTDNLEMERTQLLNYFALPDTEEWTIPTVLETLATLHNEMFGGILVTKK